MTTDQIIFFLTLAKCQHLTFAADQLHISQPALSHSLQRLEEEMGYPLFDRIGRGIKLNKSGEIFLSYCKNIMYNYENAKTELRQMNDEMSNIINVYWTQKFAIDQYLINFMDQNPDISLNLKRATSEEIDEGLLTGECDFGLIQTMKDQWSAYSYISIPTPCWYIAISSRNPLSRKGLPPKLSDLQGMNFVCLALDEQHISFTRRLCNRAGFEPDIVFQSTPKMCLDLVADRDWVFLSPRDDFILASGNIYYRELISFSPLYPDEYDSTLRLLYNKKKVFSDVGRRFFEYISTLDGATVITTP